MPFLADEQKPSSDGSALTRLDAWDQAAMRAYMKVALCFPFDNSRTAAAAEHIKASLARLALQRPDIAGTLEVREGGVVYLRTGPRPDGKDAAIPFSVVDITAHFPYASYDELKAAEFPASAFVGLHFDQPCPMGENKPPVPVAIVKAFTIPGGLLLGIYFSHAFADGDCLRIFLNSFSGQTCHKFVDGAKTKTLNIPSPYESKNGADAVSYLNTLAERIPEYVVLDKPLGPIFPKLRVGGVPMEDIVKTGKIFVFDNTHLRKLRCSILNACGELSETSNGHAQRDGHSAVAQGKPSNYTCLAALTWAHVSRARISDPIQYVLPDVKADNMALLQTMVNWKSRAFREMNPDYYGNATAVSVTQLPTNGILREASSDRSRLKELVYAIEKTISGVNDESIRDRTELFRRLPDPRLLGLRFDPRSPQDLGFNTWRYFGANTEWIIPGVSTEATIPDALRRMQEVWNMSGALILPAKSSSTVHELLVTLPQTSMDRLCQDPEWMRWVDRVIG